MNSKIYLRYFAELEKSIVSVERIREYQQTETEAAFEKPESDPPQEWPESGKIEFDNYQTRYRTGLDLVLKGLIQSLFIYKCDTQIKHLLFQVFHLK